MESADPSVAEVEVDRNGIVTIQGIGRGVTEITVTAADRREESVSQTVVVTVGGPALVALVPRAADLVREGFVRVINHSGGSAEIAIEAIDDAGTAAGPVVLTLDANETAHFNSKDLEDGNADKGLSGGVGPGEGDWRLVLDSDLDFEVLSYIRTEDGFLTAIHDVVPLIDGTYRVAIFNPGDNPNQVSHLRLINPGGGTAEVTVEGIDDAGDSPGDAVTVDVPAGESVTLTASELESGIGLEGALGDGFGKWRLSVTSDKPIVAMSLLSSPTGHLTNLSTIPRTPDEDGAYVVPLFPAASDALGRQGFVRAVNRSDGSGTVSIEAFDDSDLSYPPVSLALNAQTNAALQLGRPGAWQCRQRADGQYGRRHGRLAAGAVERSRDRRAGLHPHGRRVPDPDARCRADAVGRAAGGDLQPRRQSEPGEPAAAGQPGDGGRAGDDHRR